MLHDLMKAGLSHLAFDLSANVEREHGARHVKVVAPPTHARGLDRLLKNDESAFRLRQGDSKRHVIRKLGATMKPGTDRIGVFAEIDHRFLPRTAPRMNGGLPENAQGEMSKFFNVEFGIR